MCFPRLYGFKIHQMAYRSPAEILKDMSPELETPTHVWSQKRNFSCESSVPSPLWCTTVRLVGYQLIKLP